MSSSATALSVFSIIHWWVIITPSPPNKESQCQKDHGDHHGRWRLKMGDRCEQDAIGKNRACFHVIQTKKYMPSFCVRMYIIMFRNHVLLYVSSLINKCSIVCILCVSVSMRLFFLTYHVGACVQKYVLIRDATQKVE